MTSTPTKIDIFAPEPARNTYVGGGDAGTVLGVNPYDSRLDLYNRLAGLADPVAPNYRMNRGSCVESALRQWYLDQQDPGSISSIAVQGFLRHEDYPTIGGHPDLVVASGAGTLKLVEFKETRLHWEWGSAKTPEVPERVSAQAIAYGEMVRRSAQNTFWKFDPVIDVVVDFGGAEPEIYNLYLDQNVADWVCREMSLFWSDHVEKKVPPPPTNPAQCLAAYPAAQARVVATASAKAELNLKEADDLAAVIKDLAEKRSTLIAEVMRDMQDAEILLTDNGQTLATWKNVNSTTLDRDALKRKHPLAYSDCLVTKQTRRFLPKKIKNNNNG